MNGKINNIEQICSVKRLQYSSGRAKGIEILLVNNGRLCFELIVDKCLDIGSLYHKGVNIGFLTAGGINAGEHDFQHAFNGGFLYTCGLDSLSNKSLPFHGRIHNTPAEIEKIEVNENGIEIVGTVKQVTLFGEKLTLKRTIKTAVNSDELEVSDEITNTDYVDTQYCILYHTNIGYPMLDEGVTVSAPITSTTPINEFSASKQKSCFVMDEPSPGLKENVYFHTVEKGDVTVKNEKLGKEVNITYNEKVLPYLIQWKSMMSGAYALGIEPCTTMLGDYFEKTTIKAGETVKAGIKVRFS